MITDDFYIRCPKCKQELKKGEYHNHSHSPDVEYIGPSESIAPDGTRRVGWIHIMGGL